MKIRLKINKVTGVAYIPKFLVEDGFSGNVDVFGYGPVMVIIRPGTEPDTAVDCLHSISKEVRMTPYSEGKK